MYLITTRPDILYVVSVLYKFLNSPNEVLMKVAKRVLGYVKGTIDYGVRFSKYQNFKLWGFSDSDWAGSVEDIKSTSGYCFSFCSGYFSWCSKKQAIIAQSTAEAEFVAATASINQALWMKKIACDLGLEIKKSTEVFVDNQAAIAISHNPVFHGKIKHFNMKLYFLREVQKDGLVNLVHCKMEEQLTDIFTKALPASKFEILRMKLAIYSS
ncbi:secreted RxLR effector protein 161-like [Nicotiana tabacum]|uniref:Secreted RxLR effector protein 161-like n=1 Tax=Nicotiana tabacum TaxID=4097 RepID=A0AC58S6B4_TOBAC